MKQFFFSIEVIGGKHAGVKTCGTFLRSENRDILSDI